MGATNTAETPMLCNIKKLAKRIKAEQGVQHTAALDLAAQAKGFRNYRHALNSEREKVPS